MNELDDINTINKKTCNKCMNEFNNENKLNFFNCNHIICDNCLKNELKLKIENEDFNTLLFCPIENCWYSFSDDYINKLENKKLKDKYFKFKNRFNKQINDNYSVNSKNIFILNDKERRKKTKSFSNHRNNNDTMNKHIILTEKNTLIDNKKDDLYEIEEYIRESNNPFSLKEIIKLICKTFFKILGIIIVYLLFLFLPSFFFSLNAAYIKRNEFDRNKKYLIIIYAIIFGISIGLNPFFYMIIIIQILLWPFHIFFEKNYFLQIISFINLFKKLTSIIITIHKCGYLILDILGDPIKDFKY